jgi:hypothetical protein
MGDEVDPLITEAHAELRLSHRRILAIMAITSIFGVVIALAMFDVRTGLGVLVGVGLAYASYFWQRRSMRRMFEKAERGEKPFVPALAYIARYIILGAILWLLYATDVFPVIAVVAGFGAFALAVVVEGFIGIFNGPR